MRIIYLSVFVLIADQLSKMAIKGFSIPFLNIHHAGMYQGERIEVLGEFFRITYIENPGMAFGFDPGSGFKFWVSLFSIIASIGLIVYLYIARTHSFSLRLSLALILGGAFGNLIDRVFYGVFYGYAPLFYGRVVDFLDVDFIDFSLFGKQFDRWPIFNIADASVTIGVTILLMFYKKHQDEAEEREKIKEGVPAAASDEEGEVKVMYSDGDPGDIKDSEGEEVSRNGANEENNNDDTDLKNDKPGE